MENRESMVRKALVSNGIFSGFSGLALAIFSSQVAAVMAIKNHYILLFVGIGLVLFSTSIFAIVLKKEINAKKVKFIILQDWAWVLGSATLLVFNPFEISLTGNVMIGAVAAVVGAFAILQAIGAKKLSSTN